MEGSAEPVSLMMKGAWGGREGWKGLGSVGFCFRRRESFIVFQTFSKLVPTEGSFDSNVSSGFTLFFKLKHRKGTAPG